jgi:DNA-binding HxlR family transcriptional regulator
MKQEETFICGIGPAFEVVGGKWKAMILWELRERPLRFGEIKRRIAGASEKMLIQQLRALERDGLLIRHVFPMVPPHVEYSLSPWGISLNTALGPICDWGESYATSHGHHPSESVDARRR